MISAQTAIFKARRDLMLGWVLKVTLILAAGVSVAMGANGPVVFLLLGLIWLALSFRSAQGSRLAVDSTPLIAAGEFEEAERRIEQSLGTFSMFRTVKLLSLHHLALSRHAQRRWPDSVMLCRALLGQRLGSLKGLSRSSRLILADSLLELGDLQGAYGAINDLFGQRLTLGEAINLLEVQLDYESGIGAWGQMIGQLRTKVQLAELMPTMQSARVQAFLALAARKLGKVDCESWLRRRVDLLVDTQELAAQRPVLAELWNSAA